MAVFSKRVALLLLFAFILLTIAFRYPSVDHERYQADSYFIHLLSKAIVHDGRALWTFNPLSYFGYYPLSYPSGAPFLLAEFSLMTGLTIEVSTLVSSMLFGLLFCLAAFCIAREFLFESRFVLLATLFMITGSRFVDTTYWVGSARGPLVVLMILSLVVAFRASSLKRHLLLPVAAALAFGCLALHHMAVLYVFFGAAFILSSIAVDYVVKKATVHKRRVFAIYTAAVLVAIAVAAFALFSVFKDAIVELHGTGFFGSESALASIVLSISASYTAQIGLILPIAIIGIPFIYRMRGLRARSAYPLILLISLTPLLGKGLYVAMLVAPFVAILATMWIRMWFAPRKPKKAAVVALAAIVACSMFLPLWNVDRWNSQTIKTFDTVEVDSQVFDDAAYISYGASEGYMISNAIVVSGQLSAISDARFLGPGIGGVLTGVVTREQVEGNVTLSLAAFPSNLLNILGYDDKILVERNVISLMVEGARFAARPGTGFFDTYSHLIVVVDSKWPNTLVSQYYSPPARFLSELLTASWHNSSVEQPLPSYMMYQSERITLYLVELPV